MSYLKGNYAFSLIILYLQRKGIEFCLRKQEFTKVKKQCTVEQQI